MAAPAPDLCGCTMTCSLLHTLLGTCTWWITGMAEVTVPISCARPRPEVAIAVHIKIVFFIAFSQRTFAILVLHISADDVGSANVCKDRSKWAVEA